MSLLEYLRRRRPPLTPERRQLFLEVAAAVDANIRAARTLTSAAAGEAAACGCWPQYTTCRCAVRAERRA